MVPILSAIAAPLPEHFTMEFEPGLLIAAFLATLVVSVLLVLMSAALSGRQLQESNDPRVFDEAPTPRLRPTTAATPRKRHSLAA